MSSYANHIETELFRINEAVHKYTTSIPNPIRPIVEHILLAQGKRLRPMLVILFAKLLGYEGQDIYSLSAAAEFIHAATLLHDDVLDDAILRKGQPATHTIFNVTPTILAGDALLAKGTYLVAKYGDQKSTMAVSKALNKTAQGEILEATSQGTIWDKKTYLDVITGKTAWVIRTACELGALKAHAKQKQIALSAAFGLNLGIAFQIVDDALDFAPSKTTGKPEGGDLKEGKSTPPIIYYMESLSCKNKKIFSTKFKNNSFTDEEIKIIAQVIREKEFDKKTRNIASNYFKKALQTLELIKDIPNPEYKMILTEYLECINIRTN